MTTEKIKDLINCSELPQLQKNVMNGFVDRAKEQEEKKREERELISSICTKSIEDVIFSSDDVKIFTIRGKDDWDKEYPYRSIFLKDGKWITTNVVSPNFDLAFLVYLQHKHLGYNSQFVDFAMKMLEMPK